MGAQKFDSEPVSQENSTQNNAPPVSGSIETEPVPTKRGKRATCASIIVCAIAATLVLIFGIINRKEDVYYLDETTKNTTNACYKKEKKLTFSSLFTTTLGLFSIVVGTLIDRLSLLVEEHRHLNERYGGSWRKMIKACFSGIIWRSVCALLLLTSIIHVIIITTTDRPWFELTYLVYTFSGIGVGPLIMHLLNLNTESEVYISTILEEKGTYVANGLAWSYYFNYLEQALPKFKDAVRSRLPSPYENITLSSPKLLLLIPFDWPIEDDLNNIDDRIEQLFHLETSENSFRFPVYHLSAHGKYFAIQYVEGPLKALRKMGFVEGIEAVKRKTFHKEVEVLYRTLLQILEDPPEETIKETCILVPIKAGRQERLQNGELGKCIIEVVKRSSTQADGVREPKVIKRTKRNLNKANDIEAQTSHSCDKQHDKSITKTEKAKKYEEKQPKETEQEELMPAPEIVDLPDPKKPYLQEVGCDIDSVASTSAIDTEMASTPANDQQEYEEEKLMRMKLLLMHG